MGDDSSSTLRVAMASPEIAPLAKTGGLGEVVGALPKALERLGVRVILIMPAYRYVLNGGFPLTDTGVRFTVPLSNRYEAGSLLETESGGVQVYLVRADSYFDRDNLYGDSRGDYPDNAERFVFFSRAVLEVLKLDPTVLHTHDWQSALAIPFLKAQPGLYPALSKVKTVCTVHNLGHQGLFWHHDWHLLNLDWRFFTPRYLEFYGKINFLKGGLVFADRITTVSPTYAEEIKTAERGFGLDGVFRERADRLTGILNGVDYEIWDPERDRLIAANYNSGNLEGKKTCKLDLQRRFNLPENTDAPLIGMVSRLAAQKGFDLLEPALDRLLSKGVQLVVLGTGDDLYQKSLGAASKRFQGRMSARFAFDDSLAHKVIAGSDMFLMPSRYEPAGLAQIYSLKYGTIPIVRATGGLKDSITQFDQQTGSGNGFVFDAYEPADLLTAVDRALAVFKNKYQWNSLMIKAMHADFSWDRSARIYADMYRGLVS